MPEDRYPEDYILEKMQELMKDDEMRAVPKAIILKNLTRAAIEASAFENPYLVQIKKQMSGDLNYKVPWINQANIKVRREVENIKEQLEKVRLPDIKTAAKSIAFNRWLLIAVLNRDVQIIGAVQKKLDSGELYPALLLDNIKSVWSVIPRSEKLPNYSYKAVKLTDNGQFVFTQEGRKRAFLGQVLLGWADHQDINEFLSQGPYPVTEVNVDWPYSWPDSE